MRYIIVLTLALVFCFTAKVQASYVDEVQRLEFKVEGTGFSYDAYDGMIPEGWRRASIYEMLWMLHNYGFTTATNGEVNWPDDDLELTPLVQALGITESDTGYADWSEGQVLSFDLQNVRILTLTDNHDPDGRELVESNSSIAKSISSPTTGAWLVRRYIPPSPPAAWISGFVTDTNGIPIPQAIVRIRVDGQIVQQLTNLQGYYRFLGLRDRQYNVVVNKAMYLRKKAVAMIRQGKITGWGDHDNVNFVMD